MCADLEGIPIIAELMDVAHGGLTGSSISVGRIRLSPPTWPQTTKETLDISWVLQDGVRIS